MTAPTPETYPELYGNRDDDFRIDLLDLSDNLIDQLTWSDAQGFGAEYGGSIDFSIGTETREMAKLSIVLAFGSAVDWLQHHIRIYYVGGGQASPQALSTLMPTAAPATFYSSHWSEAMEFHGLLYKLRAVPGYNFGLRAGTVVTDAMKDILALAGILNFTVTDSSRTLAASMIWEPTDSWLRILNDLAKAIGYWSMYTDPYGGMWAEPYVDPSARPITFNFDDGPVSGLYLPGWQRDRDLRVPNRVILIQRVEGDETPLIVSAELPPEHPLSKDSLGFYEDRVEPDVDFADYESGLIRAQRLLGDGTPSETRTFEHPWVPNVRLNNIVTHSQRTIGELVGSVRSQTVRIQTGGLWQTTIRGINYPEE